MKKNTKKYLLILLCLPLLITGCKQIPKLENGEEVIAEIEGKQFTTQEFYESLKEQYGTSALVSMIDTYIAEKESTDEMTEKATASAQAEINAYSAQYGDQWLSTLSGYGYSSEEELLNQLITNYKQNLILENYVATTITDEEIKDYYDESIYGEITARHILITPETTEEMSEEEKATAKEAALAKAKELIEQLGSSSNLEEDFSNLAKENSKDPGSASEGGLISNFTNESGLVDEFWETSLNLNVGEYTAEPVETEYGYHIIYKVSQNEKPNLEDVKDKIIDKVSEQALSTDNAKYIYWGGLREKYGMKIHDSEINDSYKTTQDSIK